MENGCILNFYDSGKLTYQGKCCEEVKIWFKGNENLHKETSHLCNKVFVVYGHDKISRDQLEAMLRRWHLDPLILEQLPSEGQTIIEKLEKYIHDVDFAVILATPDDKGQRADHPDEIHFVLDKMLCLNWVFF